MKQSRAALLPTVTASTNQGVGYSPFDESGADKTYYSGSYNVNAQWTVWNGGQNTNALKINKLTAEQSELSVDENFRRLCFLPRSLLFREFDETFSKVFGLRVATRGRILRLLVDGCRSASELAQQERRPLNGAYTEALRDLSYAGFVAEDAST